MSDAVNQRKPLAVKNVSRLPMPGSRLKAPTNFKRAHSPDGDHYEMKQRKRSRTDSFEADLPKMKQLSQVKSSSSLAASKSSATLRKQPCISKITRNVAAASQRPKLPSFAKTAPNPVVANGIKQKPGVGGASRKPLTGAVSKPNVGTNNVKPPAVAVAATAGGKKRAAWDVKGRLLDTEQTLRICQAELGELRKGTHTEIQDLVSSRSALQDERDRLDSEVSGLRQSLADLRQTHTQMTVELETNKRSFSKSKELVSMQEAEIAQLKETIKTVEGNIEASLKREQNLETEIKKCDQKILELEQNLASASQLIATREGEILQLKANIKSVERDIEESNKREQKFDSEIQKCNTNIETLERNLEEAKQTIVSRNDKITGLEDTVQMMQDQINEFKQNEQLHEVERRRLHNMVQELKGNIRVFCRVRPLLENETLGNNGVIPHMNFPDVDHKYLELEKLDSSLNESMLSSSRRGQSKHEFQFDRVFQPEASQAEVFSEISQLVQSALDGYNVCIFAYGQTGSGKTYTMEGPSVDDRINCGMISRAVKQIFETARKLEENGWQYEFKASMLEIYNETIRDLVDYRADKKHEIRLVGKDNTDTEVTDLSVLTVTSEQQVHKLLKKASENRAVAETKCNEHSSRSHSVFQLKLHGTNSITTETCSGILSLVDLAGSERLKESQSEGQRLKETLSINKSLSNLGNVIMALGNKDSHVPYRNSTLTYLLKSSLGGNSKTLMFVNVSPKEECFPETLNSLRFATKVKPV
ncbi:carboxy-terminal kinesin 2-like [Gigantopelta aegis]|uniref:carboxy-terminal kinesin 2-like n=1 Tax=Gigantopelta aegis TaxID=1735272 RepID=UPI001B88B6E6|nr:carboxy-terminal kinesin 2-like [Gigantopelta aegis]